MASSSNEQLDAAEKNILYLNELKAVILAKNQLLKLKHLSSEPKDISDINVEQEKKNLITSLLNKSNLNHSHFRMALDLFTRENIINNDSESDDPQFKMYKENIFETLQALNQSTNNLQALISKLRTLTKKHQEIQEEVSAIEQNSKTPSEPKIANVQATEEKKQQIKLRVEKINLMIAIINGFLHNARGVDWEKDPQLEEIVRMCRDVYKIK